MNIQKGNIWTKAGLSRDAHWPNSRKDLLTASEALYRMASLCPGVSGCECAQVDPVAIAQAVSSTR